MSPDGQYQFDIFAQPNDSTCGPTCLQAVYRHFGDDIGLDQVIEETRMLREGGTLSSLLGIHALDRGYKVVIHPYNLDIWDPTWFDRKVDLAAKLRAQLELESDDTFRFVSNRYIEFLERGGSIQFKELTARLLRGYLSRGLPILTMVSATYLYMESREIWATGAEDDVRGEPAGHFIILFELNDNGRHVSIADPLGHEQPLGSHVYHVRLERLIGAILLGVLTYDSTLMVLEPPERLGWTGGRKAIGPESMA